jgi:hypothetical protein
MVLQPRHRLLALDVRDALVRISQSSGIRSHTGMVAHRDPNDFLHIGRANDAASGSKQPMAPKEAGRVDAARRG